MTVGSMSCGPLLVMVRVGTSRAGMSTLVLGLSGVGSGAAASRHREGKEFVVVVIVIIAFRALIAGTVTIVYGIVILDIHVV